MPRRRSSMTGKRTAGTPGTDRARTRERNMELYHAVRDGAVVFP